MIDPAESILRKLIAEGNARGHIIIGHGRHDLEVDLAVDITPAEAAYLMALGVVCADDED